MGTIKVKEWHKVLKNFINIIIIEHICVLKAWFFKQHYRHYADGSVIEYFNGTKS